MKKEKIIKIGIYHTIVLIVLLFIIFIYKCPMLYVTGIPCPGCGITRAIFAALRFDFKAAFSFHPLFFTVPPVVLYVAHRNVLKRRFSTKTEVALLCVLSVIFVIVYVYRFLVSTL